MRLGFHWGIIGLVVFAALPRRRGAWLRIFVVRRSLPCDPPIAVIHAGKMIPRFQPDYLLSQIHLYALFEMSR
jgi:hypothetical protein